MGDFFMEENYLTRSKIHTKAIAVTMAMMVENGRAYLMNYHDILYHWYKWIHINAPFYENLNHPSRGEHLELTLAKLRASFPAYISYAKSVLNDLETIISLYNDNKDFFAGLYKDRTELRRKMEAHLAEEEKKYEPEGEVFRLRAQIDNELETILCDYRHSRKLRAKLEELEDKYSITIDPDNTQRWFERSQEIYKAYNEKYDAFDEYKSVCRTAFCDNYIEDAALTAEKVYKVLAKEIMDNESPFVPSCQTVAEPDTELSTRSDVETRSAVKIYLNEDTCQSFYRSGAVECFLKNSNEEMFFQLMNLNFPDPESGLKLKYVDGLFYVLYVLKDFLVDEGSSQDWITEILEYFDKKYETYQGHYTDVIGDSENEKSTAFRLYRIVKDWLKLRK